MLDGMKIAAIVGIVILILAIIILQPLAIIWAINTIAPAMSIPYSFWTWLATVVLYFSTFGGLNASIRSLK